VLEAVIRIRDTLITVIMAQFSMPLRNFIL
jgi:hypothetical protein